MYARAVAILISLVMGMTLAACGSSGSSGTTAPGGIITVSGAWVRAAAAGGTSAGYLTIVNGSRTDDALVGVSAPDITASASLHETTTDASGMTGMTHTESVKIASSDTVRLEPGGYHVMLMNLTKELKVGDVVRLTLTFKQAGVLQVNAEVRAG